MTWSPSSSGVDTMWALSICNASPGHSAWTTTSPTSPPFQGSQIQIRTLNTAPATLSQLPTFVQVVCHER